MLTIKITNQILRIIFNQPASAKLLRLYLFFDYTGIFHILVKIPVTVVHQHEKHGEVFSRQKNTPDVANN